jgi:hypothetical protein
MSKYEECYEISWKELSDAYSTERVARDILREFYDMIAVLERFLDENGIDGNKQTISELFEIVDKEQNIEKLSVNQ